MKVVRQIEKLLGTNIEYDAFADSIYHIQGIPYSSNILQESTKSYAGKTVWMNPPYIKSTTLLDNATKRLQMHAKDIVALVPEWLSTKLIQEHNFVHVKTYEVGEKVFHKAGQQLLPLTFKVHVLLWKQTKNVQRIPIKLTNMTDQSSYSNGMLDSGSEVTLIAHKNLPKDTKLSELGTHQLKQADGKTPLTCMGRTALRINDNLVLAYVVPYGDNILGQDYLHSSKDIIINTDIDYQVLKENNTLYTCTIACTEQPSKRPLSDNEHALKERLERKFPHLFSPDGKLRTVKTRGRNFDFRIELLPGTEAVAKQPYRFSAKEIDTAAQKLKDALERNWVSDQYLSEWSAPVLFAKAHKDDTLRMVVDYRSLNAATIPLAYPMPRVDELLEWVAKRRFYTSIDLVKAFHQVPIEEASRHYCAFSTPQQSVVPLVMQFGLKNASQTFQRYLDAVFHGTAPLPDGKKHSKPLADLSDIVRAYIDDIIIASMTEAEHQKNLETVLERLELYKLACHPLEKTIATEVDLLGYTISFGKIKPNASKIQDLEKLTFPQTQKQARAKLGMLSYYRSVINNFARIAKPIYDMANGHHVEQETVAKAHALLIETLMKQTAMVVPDGTPMTIHVDASNVGFGAALTREDGKPIAFISKCWKTSAQQAYAPYKAELYCLLYSLQRWRHWLEGQQVTVYTDHLPLVRKEILSKTQPEHDRLIVRWLDQISGLDIHLHYIKGKENIVADHLSRLSVNAITMKEAHDVHKLWHTNGPTTVQNLINAGVNPDPKDLDVLNRAASECHPCQMTKENRKTNGVARHTEIPKTPWQYIAIDFLHLDGRSEEIVMVVLDRYSKFCELIPCNVHDTAAEIAELLWQHVILRYGAPEFVMTDRDSRFLANAFQELLEEHSSTHKLSAPYHHVGSVERLNRTLREIDNLLVHLQDTYADRIDRLQFMYNTRVHSSTGVSPYKALMNYNPVATTVKRLFPLAEKQLSFEQLRKKVDQRLRYTADRVQSRMQKRRTGWIPKLGSYVLLSTRNWKETMRKSRYTKWVGPFKVTKAYEYENFSLQLPPRWKQRNIFHASLLKEWNGPLPSEPYGSLDGKFLIDKILEWRTDKQGKRTHGKVQWLNYPKTDYTWEPIEELSAYTDT